MSSVAREKLVAGHDMGAALDDRLYLAWHLQHANQPVGVADVRQKNRVVEIEDDRRTVTSRKEPLDQSGSNRKDLAVHEHDVVLRDVAQRQQMVQRQPGESSRLAHVTSRLIHEPEEFRGEERPE